MLLLCCTCCTKQQTTHNWQQKHLYTPCSPMHKSKSSSLATRWVKGKKNLHGRCSTMGKGMCVALIHGWIMCSRRVHWSISYWRAWKWVGRHLPFLCILHRVHIDKLMRCVLLYVCVGWKRKGARIGADRGAKIWDTGGLDIEKNGSDERLLCMCLYFAISFCRFKCSPSVMATGSNRRRKREGRTWMKTKLQVNTNLI